MSRRTQARRIAVVTGSRADFGLLAPVIDAIRWHETARHGDAEEQITALLASPPRLADAPPRLSRPARLELQLIAAGLHLSTGTLADVEAHYPVAERVTMQRQGNVGRAADVHALARGVEGFGLVLDRLDPDVVLVLGDRIEAFAAGAAAGIGGRRLAHIHGGDRAQGVADEAMRHALSKLAHLHFAATASSRRRLIRMGELPTLVMRTGSPAVDGLVDIPDLTPQDRRDVRLPEDPATPFVLVLQHPVGADDAREQAWMTATLDATAAWPRVVMAPNGDPGAHGVRQALRDAGVTIVEHWPRERFLAVLKAAAVLVGNSSAGLIEASAVRPGGTPTVNIGPRQDGRDKPPHVIDCDYGKPSVIRSVQAALRLQPRRPTHPYGKGDAGRRIAAWLAAVDLDAIPLHKRNAY